MLDIIPFDSLYSTLTHMGLVIAPLGFSVQILSLLALLTLAIFVPISIVGTISRLVGLQDSGKQTKKASIKSVASRFFIYMIYHLFMFGLWFLIANALIGRLYQEPINHYGRSNDLVAHQNESNNSAPVEFKQNDTPIDPTREHLDAEALKAPTPSQDRVVPTTQNHIAPPSIREQELAYYEPLSSNFSPPYDPVYTKSDILSATYLLIPVYPLLFLTYIVAWTLLSTIAMHAIRKARNSQPFRPTPGLYMRRILWNFTIFGIVSFIIHRLSIY